jgi:hypothetical protein
VLEDWLAKHPALEALAYHPLISPLLHGVVVSAAVVAGWLLFQWLPYLPHADAFGAGVGFGSGMGFYSHREAGDLTRYVFGRPLNETSTQVKLADSWLDWTVAFILGLITVHLLLV